MTPPRLVLRALAPPGNSPRALTRALLADALVGRVVAAHLVAPEVDPLAVPLLDDEALDADLLATRYVGRGVLPRLLASLPDTANTHDTAHDKTLARVWLALHAALARGDGRRVDLFLRLPAGPTLDALRPIATLDVDARGLTFTFGASGAPLVAPPARLANDADPEDPLPDPRTTELVRQNRAELLEPLVRAAHAHHLTLSVDGPGLAPGALAAIRAALTAAPGAR